jgi:hypothetical protein
MSSRVSRQARFVSSFFFSGFVGTGREDVTLQMYSADLRETQVGFVLGAAPRR